MLGTQAPETFPSPAAWVPWGSLALLFGWLILRTIESRLAHPAVAGFVGRGGTLAPWAKPPDQHQPAHRTADRHKLTTKGDNQRAGTGAGAALRGGPIGTSSALSRFPNRRLRTARAGDRREDDSTRLGPITHARGVVLMRYHSDPYANPS